MKDRHKGLKVSERVTGALSLEMRFEARAWFRKRQIGVSIDLASEPQVSKRFPAPRHVIEWDSLTTD